MAVDGLLQQFYLVAIVVIVGSSLLAAAAVAVADARREAGLGRVVWVLLLFPLLPFIVVASYLRRDGDAGPVGRRRRVAVVAVIAGMVALAVGAVIAPPDPVSQMRSVTYAYPLGVLVGYLTTVTARSRRSDSS